MFFMASVRLVSLNLGHAGKIPKVHQTRLYLEYVPQ